MERWRDRNLAAVVIRQRRMQSLLPLCESRLARRTREHPTVEWLALRKMVESSALLSSNGCQAPAILGSGKPPKASRMFCVSAS